MKQRMRKVMALLCAIAMVISSITVSNAVSAAATDLPVAGAGVKIEVNNFGAGDVVFVAGLDTFTGATSYNLYVDDQLWGTVTNGQNIDIANFKAGQHKFFATGIKDGKEFAKSADFTLTIPDSGQIDIPDVVDGTEILSGLQFTDEDATTVESEDKPWFEYGGEYTNNGDGSVSIAIPAYSSGDNWATQLKQNKVQLIKDKWYKATYTVTSDVDKSIQLMVQQNVNWTVFKTDTVAVKAGETKTVEVVFQAAQTTDKVLFGGMMGYVDNTASEAANVTISGVSLKVYNSDPSVEAPTTDETTPAVTDPEETTTPEVTDPAETTTPEVTDPAETTPEVTDPVETTQAPADITMDQQYTSDGTYTVGGYLLYVGQSWNNSTAQVGVDPANPDHIKVQQLTSKFDGAWGLQVKKALYNLKAGETYTIEWPIVAASNDGTVKLTGDPEVKLVGGAQTLTATYTAKGDATDEFVVGMGWVGVTNPIEFFAPVVKDAEGNVVDITKPEDPETTTPEVTDPTETTTEAPETTDETTTVAPTTDETTTEAPTSEVTTTPEASSETTIQAPTTTKKPVKKVLKKTKITKATRKSVKAKKIKLTFKRVKNATKYKVEIATSKKFKKAIVKKTVKKVSVTIKGKALKNKKKLYVRVRAVGAKKWAVKQVKIKK